MNTILPWAISFALLAFAAATVCAAVRLLLGPNAQDRVLALDALYVNCMLIVLTLGIQFDDDGGYSSLGRAARFVAADRGRPVGTDRFLWIVEAAAFPCTHACTYLG